MLNKRVILISAATAACALGIGFMMQPSADHQPQMRQAEAAQPQLPQDPALAQPVAIEKITLTSAKPQISAPEGAVQAVPAVPVAGCALEAKGKALPGALVQLQVSAPCRPGERITLHHQGMMVTETLDEDGALDLVVPALASTATFIVVPSSSSSSAPAVALASAGRVVQLTVPDMASVDRVVLQWRGNSGFEIHAREFGAQYGEAGHVWHGADPAQGAGLLLQLGDPAQLVPHLAEIYSFSRDADHAGAKAAGDIEISIETEITEINCGREIAAQSLRMSDGRVQSRDLTLTVPDCSATGDFLVLNNLVENLKIASR